MVFLPVPSGSLALLLLSLKLSFSGNFRKLFAALFDESRKPFFGGLAVWTNRSVCFFASESFKLALDFKPHVKGIGFRVLKALLGGVFGKGAAVAVEVRVTRCTRRGRRVTLL